MRRTIGAMAALCTLVAVGAAPVVAQEASTDVLLATIAGSRTMTVTTPTGADLDGGQLDLGTGHTGAFAVTVTDVSYDHVGYQVSGTLSNLYRFDGGFDCGKRVNSGDMAVSFPIDPQLSGLGAVVEGVVDLQGTVSSALAALLDPGGVIGGILAGAGLDPLAGRDLVAPNAISGQLEDSSNKVYDGLSTVLPVKVGKGSAGAFTSAASHPTCGEGAATPTSRLLMSGDASSLGTFVERLIADLRAQVDGISADNMITGGTVDAAGTQAAAAEAIQALEDEINAELGGLGLDPIALPTTSDVIDQALAELLGLLGAVNLIGQSGAGLSLPALRATPDSAPTSGVYRGRMVVTLVDVP